MKALAVLGGVFAPPTCAHMALMERAMAQTGAEEGVFVPSSASYMRAWRAHNLPAETYLLPENRLGMLRAMLKGRENLRVCEREMRLRENAYTVDTLNELQASLRPERLYFVIGADNLVNLERWYHADELLTKYRALASARGDTDVDAALEASSFLRAHRDHISRLEIGEAFLGVSASGVRAALAAGDAARARAALAPEVYRYILSHMPEVFA